ncbi:hypothetical protein M413DRAFT_30232 [Hebeloma cylindrosporum]|uniref:DUF6534 domain-containing protein n=1 Tax=Hebeloma cylindrosporum TaxID=76867 RepID=A0A0C3C478_HEBCY|nr:hypothetical protein M413DRAFT_30232 [Hebeloma cylindrosporum h7]
MKVPVTLDDTLGAALLGVVISCILFGIAIVQTHLYYYNFPKDWMLQKASVGVLMALATLHMVFTIHALYYYLIVNFGNPEGLDTIVWFVFQRFLEFVLIQTHVNRSFKLQVLFNTLIVFLVQGLYAVRIWKRKFSFDMNFNTRSSTEATKVGKHFSRFLPAVVGFTVACGWGVGFLLIDKAYEETTFSNLSAMSPFIYMAFTTATAIDAILASAMCYYLNWGRSPFIGTSNKIVTVMRYVLITGFLTSACSLSTLMTYALMPDNMIFIGIDFLLPNIYVNSYFALLNARKSINEQQPASLDVSKMLNVKADSTLPTDSGHRTSIDDQTNPDGIPPPATRLTSNFSNRYDPEKETASQSLERIDSMIRTTAEFVQAAGTNDFGYPIYTVDVGLSCGVVGYFNLWRSNMKR